MPILVGLLVFALLLGGSYVGHRSYGTADLGGVLGLLLTTVVILWLLGALGSLPLRL